ncbi:MAG: NAD(P)/FAD-dependent oxidoreductase [Candidatus Thermoplasmatota archaeon]|nr:NAD(P)/FAD-dependent oxidoreductase [Candidatus Thermoplasmatota archaeon]
MKNFQIAIIGGGVVGSAIAWELSRYKVNVAVFEKGSDVASGASKANSGVIHSGINSTPSSLKAKYCVEGNKLFQSIADELHFPVRWVGKFVIAKDEEEVKELKHLQEIGKKNNVQNLEIQDGSHVQKKEKNVCCHAALWVPGAGITEPYKFTIALAENAAENKVSFFLETEVKGMRKEKDFFKLQTNNGSFQAQITINAAGIHCREIVGMVEEPDFQVYPCRGEYLVLDKNYASLIASMIYPVPVKEMGVLGVHLTPTIDGNILLGPSAEFINDVEDKKTTKETMKTLFAEAKDIIPILPERAVINAYAGIRCKLASPSKGGWADYRIEQSEITPGLINLLGIESPGLTAAPALAKDIVRMIGESIPLKTKEKVKHSIKRTRFVDLPQEEQSQLIAQDERWGRIVCRCEHITEKEIIDALANPLGAKTISAVKYRCRAGMGRCQGGFCTQHIVRIMEEQCRMDIHDIKLRSPRSTLFYNRTREAKHGR